MIPAIITGLAALASLISTIVSTTQRSNQNRMGGSQGGMGGQQGGVPQGGLQFPKYGQEGMNALNQLLSMGLSGLQGNQPSFGPIAENARRDWATQSVPLLAERFGGLGARRSGAFEGVLSGANRQFEQDLRGQEQQFGQQNRNQLLQTLKLGLTSPYESIYKGRQPGFVENLGVAALPAAIQAAPELIKLWQNSGSEAAKPSEGE